MAVIGTRGLLLGDGSTLAAYYDFSGQNGTAAVAPLASTSGYTWADVAGGQVIYDYDGSSGTLDAVFVVGATRTQGARHAGRPGDRRHRHQQLELPDRQPQVAHA